MLTLDDATKVRDHLDEIVSNKGMQDKVSVGIACDNGEKDGQTWNVVFTFREAVKGKFIKETMALLMPLAEGAIDRPLQKQDVMCRKTASLERYDSETGQAIPNSANLALAKYYGSHPSYTDGKGYVRS
ncbi:MAG: hypothetical protein U1E36_04350 [Rickettsiales bacterium]